MLLSAGFVLPSMKCIARVVRERVRVVAAAAFFLSLWLVLVLVCRTVPLDD